ncbi:cell wall anchor protein [Actinoplanes solisilvae]|uniref:cell wall anchor protein n=1 Tax=Actinoplanes solisilvae TaxID=2486853 RepID=UPI000FDA8AA1|nr:cell wall anchor protein [Actinoplanes solisilvae]
MNLLKSKLRRTTAVVAGAILGLGGVAFLASPASAHHSELKGTAVCDTASGDWVVTWSVNTVVPPGVNSWGLREVTAGPSALEPATDEFKLATSERGQFPYSVKETVKGIQKVKASEPKATLAVKAAWNNGHKETKPITGEVVFEGKCAPDAPKPTAQLASNCEGVTVTLSNGAEATADAKFTVKGDNGFTESVVVKKGEDSKTVTVPGKDAGKIVVTEGKSETPLLVGKWEKPEECTPPTEVEPDAYFAATCEDLSFTIDNTKGTKTVEAKFTPNKGEAQSLTVKPGEKATATFKGEKGLEVTATGGDEPITVKWDEEKPEDCDGTASPSPSATASPTEAAPAPGEGGGLPVTGPVAGSIAGGAALLLIAGGVLFFMARRRKVKFTA